MQVCSLRHAACAGGVELEVSTGRLAAASGVAQNEHYRQPAQRYHWKQLEYCCRAGWQALAQAGPGLRRRPEAQSCTAAAQTDWSVCACVWVWVCLCVCVCCMRVCVYAVCMSVSVNNRMIPILWQLLCTHPAGHYVSYIISGLQSCTAFAQTSIWEAPRMDDSLV